MKDYRINVRFRMEDPDEARAAAHLKSLDGSRNRFIVQAVLKHLDSGNDALLDSIRKIFQEEVLNGVVAVAPAPVSTFSTELTEEEKQRNADSVLDILAMFD